MIHYHGAPVSGPIQESARFYRGRHILVSFAFPEHLPTVADVASSFILDNGAFSAWKSGTPLDIPGYYEFVGSWRHHPSFDWALIPDIIDGNEADNDNLVSNWPFKGIGVPVWHLHESIERLQNLADNFPRIALGSSGSWPTPGTDSWWERMEVALDAITNNGKPLCKLHGLRMLNPAIFTKLPLASADSTNATMNAGSISRFGTYAPKDAWYRANVIADIIENQQSPALWARHHTPEALFSLE